VTAAVLDIKQWGNNLGVCLPLWVPDRQQGMLCGTTLTARSRPFEPPVNI